MKLDKTYKFSWKSSFSSYVQQKQQQKNKELIQLTSCVSWNREGWWKEKGTRLTQKRKTNN